MSATSTVWLIDENGNRIPGMHQTLTGRLTPEWKVEMRASWKMSQDATLAGHEVVAVRRVVSFAPVSVRKGDRVTSHLWFTLAEDESARVDYMRDRIDIDEFEQRIDRAIRWDTA